MRYELDKILFVLFTFLVEHNDMKTHYPRLDVPGTEFKPMNRQVNQTLVTYLAWSSQHIYICSSFLWVMLIHFLHFCKQGRQDSLREFSLDTSKLSIKTHGNDNANNSGNGQSVVTPRGTASSSSQLLLQRRQFAESQIGRTSFQKLLEPSSSQIPGIAPYRVVLGDVKEKVLSLPISIHIFSN